MANYPIKLKYMPILYKTFLKYFYNKIIAGNIIKCRQRPLLIARLIKIDDVKSTTQVQKIK